jgi:hypothetical protein
VTTEKVGRVRTCRLKPEPLSNVQVWIAARQLNWERRLDRLAPVASAQPSTEPADGEITA